MKNETTAIISLSALLLLSLFYIFYTSGASSNSNEYERLYHETRETIGIITEANSDLRKSLDGARKLQEQLDQLQSKYDEALREREISLARRQAYERTAREINTAITDTIDRSYEAIDDYYRTIEDSE